MSWSASGLRVGLALLDQFKPSSKIFLLTVSGRYFFFGSFVFFIFCDFHALTSVLGCLVVACWGGGVWPLAPSL